MVLFPKVPLILWIGSEPSTRCGRVHFEHSHKKWLVITVRPTTSVRKSPRKNLPPRNTPDSFCRLLHPTKSSLRCVGGIFLFCGKKHLENFMSRQDVIPAFQPTPLHTQGQALRSEQTVTPLHEQRHLYLFLRLNNSETFVEN